MQHKSSAICLRGVYVLDESGGFEGPVDIAIADGSVEAIASSLPLSEARDIDEFAGQWMMPGIFDCHAHLACWADDTLGYLQMPVTKWTLNLAANARRLLELGVTFVRDPGDSADAGMRDGIAEGLVPGPTLQVAISMLSQTGGHGDGFLAGAGLEAPNSFLMSEYPGRPLHVADGVDGVRLAVRKILRAGADWVKICTTGGLLSPGLDHPDAAEFSRAEIDVAVGEARRKQKPVAAHAYGGDGLRQAVDAGVRSIEHGLRLTEEQAKAMAAAGCWLVPTLAVMHEMAASSRSGLFSESIRRRVEEIEPIIGDAVAIARAAGVRIAVGTDLITQGANLRELVYLRDAGLTASEALLAATREGAELCGVGDRLGRIAPGYQFDAIVLDEDPSELAPFRSRVAPAVAVFQRGAIVHRGSGA